MEDMCIQERTLNRILMGFHASTNTHISDGYIDFKNKNFDGTENKYPNHELYFWLVGNFPDRIRNLYYYYSFLMRAVNAASERLLDYNLRTGDIESDIKSKSIL